VNLGCRCETCCTRLAENRPTGRKKSPPKIRRSTQVNKTLHDVWPSPELVHYIHFWGLLACNGILPGAKFTLRPSLALSCKLIGSVTARHSSCGHQLNFVALSRAPTIFGRAAITLGIGPHSSYFLVYYVILHCIVLYCLFGK